MKATLYSHPRCSTCRNARRWLETHDIPFEIVDLTAAAPPREVLREIQRRADVPLRRLFNTSGQVYRAGDYGRRLPDMDEDAMLAELAADGLLVRRPLLLRGDLALVGFSPETYKSLL